MAAVLAVVIISRGGFSQVQVHQWKWIWMRGAFGCLTMLLAWMAVASGAPLGDASALGGVNVVVAALLARVFLGEPLHTTHILALSSTLVGSVLVSKPISLIDGEHLNGSTPWLGYALALGSGICSGGLFIASRKSQDISPLVMSFSVTALEGVCLWSMALTGLLPDGPWEFLAADPALALSLFLVLMMIITAAVITTSVGSQLCPAAASSTIYTSVSMTLGYIAQCAIHRKPPEVLTVAGASLMLLGVTLIAAARWWQSKEALARGLAASLLPSESECEGQIVSPHAATSSCKSAETVSLASFIASEFSGLVPAGGRSVRQRRPKIAATFSPVQAAIIFSA